MILGWRSKKELILIPFAQVLFIEPSNAKGQVRVHINNLKEHTGHHYCVIEDENEAKDFVDKFEAYLMALEVETFGGVWEESKDGNRQSRSKRGNPLYQPTEQGHTEK